MNGRRHALDVLDHVLHLLWQIFAMVGLFTVVGFAGESSELSRFRWPMLLGLLFGILTSPFVVRRIRPRLQRRFPWAFDDGTVRSQLG